MEEARSLLTGDEDRIVTNLSAEEVLKRARLIRVAAVDFCHSLAHGSQFKMVKRSLRADLREQDDADMNWYMNQPKQTSDAEVTLDDPNWFVQHTVHENRSAIEGAWNARSFQRFIEGGMELKHFQEAGRNCTLREGAADLFDLMTHRVVISMGIEEVIRASLEHHGLKAAIAAARLHFNPEGRMIGYHRNLVVSTSKRAALEQFRKLNGHDEAEHLVLGDTFLDIEMMPMRAFNVWILPPSADYAEISTYRDAHFETMVNHVTVVLYSHSLMPLVELIRASRI